MIWFTSDWHLDHANIIRLCNRPFKDVEEMNNTILNNFFNVVQTGEHVYFLGDLAFGQRLLPAFFQRVKERGIFFHVILGNHDKDLIRLSKTQEFVIQYYGTNTLTINDIRSITLDHQSITLCHYPMLTFDKSHFGAWQLYGHHHDEGYHKDIPAWVMGKKMDVAVDITGFKPVSWDQVKEYMAKQPDNFDLRKDI